MRIEIEHLGEAQRTDQPADPGVVSSPTNDKNIEIRETCTAGHIRRITVDGICYVQMCCGGQWLFWHRGNTWCTCNLGQSWTVNCDGNNWIIPCR
jgi:hypothetical protein